MVIEYAALNKDSGARLSFRKARLRAELKEINKKIAELKALEEGKDKTARRHSVSAGSG